MRIAAPALKEPAWAILLVLRALLRLPPSLGAHEAERGAQERSSSGEFRVAEVQCGPARPNAGGTSDARRMRAA